MTDREYALENDGTYASNNDIILRMPNDYDLDALCVLEVEQDPTLKMRYDDDDVETRRKYKRIIYNNDFGENFHLAIIDAKENTFVGELNVQGYKTDAPEIGITLLEVYQGKEIAAKTIELYMNKRTDINPVIYFTVRIETKNINSQKMIAKLNSEKIMQIRDAYCYKICNE